MTATALATSIFNRYNELRWVSAPVRLAYSSGRGPTHLQSHTSLYQLPSTSPNRLRSESWNTVCTSSILKWSGTTPDHNHSPSMPMTCTNVLSKPNSSSTAAGPWNGRSSSSSKNTLRLPQPLPRLGGCGWGGAFPHFGTSCPLMLEYFRWNYSTSVTLIAVTPVKHQRQKRKPNIVTLLIEPNHALRVHSRTDWPTMHTGCWLHLQWHWTVHTCMACWLLNACFTAAVFPETELACEETTAKHNTEMLMYIVATTCICQWSRNGLRTAHYTGWETRKHAQFSCSKKTMPSKNTYDQLLYMVLRWYKEKNLHQNETIPQHPSTKSKQH